MKKSYLDLNNDRFDVKFIEHDISKYDVLFHVTLKENRKSIEEKGLLIGQPKYKSMIDTNMLFFSYPIDMNTSDCFRWSDEYHSLIVLDAKKLKQDGFIFYDDFWGSIDQSSKRNHLCCEKNIPKEYITEIIEF